MDRTEFAVVMNYIAVAVRKRLDRHELEVYFDLLQDLPADTLQVAAKRVLLEHKYPTIPSIAELRAAAVSTAHGEVSELPAIEAFRLAWHAVGRIDPEVDGSRERAFKDLPPLVAETITAMGLVALCYGGEPMGVIRAQFMIAYAQLAGRDKRTSLMPAAVRQAVENIGRIDALPASAAGLADYLARKE